MDGDRVEEGIREWKVKSRELKEVQPTWPIVICKQTNRFMIYSKKYYFRFWSQYFKHAMQTMDYGIPLPRLLSSQVHLKISESLP